MLSMNKEKFQSKVEEDRNRAQKNLTKIDKLEKTELVLIEKLKQTL